MVIKQDRGQRDELGSAQTYLPCEFLRKRHSGQRKQLTLPALLEGLTFWRSYISCHVQSSHMRMLQLSYPPPPKKKLFRLQVYDFLVGHSHNYPGVQVPIYGHTCPEKCASFKF